MSNHITALNNYLQSKQKVNTLTWAESKSGPDHQVVWTVQCKIDGAVKGTGTGAGIQEAKQNAAQQALVALKAGE